MNTLKIACIITCLVLSVICSLFIFAATAYVAGVVFPIVQKDQPDIAGLLFQVVFSFLAALVTELLLLHLIFRKFKIINRR